MAVKNIEIKIELNHDNVELWLVNPSQLAQTREELFLFMKNPTHERYRQASRLAGHVDINLRDLAMRYWRSLCQAGWFTLSVFFFCIAIYLMSLVLGILTVMYWLAYPDSTSQYSEIWRYLTPAFIHFSFVHLALNIVIWWHLGARIEKRLGCRKLIWLTFIAAMVSNFAQSLFSYSHFGGLSGVVYALIGYVWLFGKRTKHKSFALAPSIMPMALLWLVIGYSDILPLLIGNEAHLSGLLVGLGMALWDTKQATQV